MYSVYKFLMQHNGIYIYHETAIYIYYIPQPLTVHFPMMRSVIYQPMLHTLYYTLHNEHAHCLSYRFFLINSHNYRH